jgi:hypothetical protein
MGLQKRLEDAFDRGVADDGASLSAEDAPYYLAWEFILDWEMGMLSGYLYNTLPDLDAIRAQVEALERAGLTELAAILRKALALFEDYTDPAEQTTWEAVLNKHDAEGILDRLDGEIEALDNYGIDS